MMYHQKTTQNAISAMSRLAELYMDSSKVASSREIAESRGLPVPLVAKILTDLSRGGLITGAPGPGGGYRLAKRPNEISLKDVVVLFERESQSSCPFGPNWCGHKDHCPLHKSLMAMKQVFDDYLTNTTFAVFGTTASKSSGEPRERSLPIAPVPNAPVPNDAVPNDAVPKAARPSPKSSVQPTPTKKATKKRNPR
ncbi:MAG: Rrf2 family transcriptional regulator [Pirellula sp.]